MHARPLRVLAVLLALWSHGPCQTTAALTKEQVAAIAQRASDKFHPAGLALSVVQDGDLLCELGFGERKPGSPVTPNTLFNIASCSKAFTVALVSQLVKE